MDKEFLNKIHVSLTSDLDKLRKIQKETPIKDEDTRLLAIAITNLETSLLYLKETISKIKG